MTEPITPQPHRHTFRKHERLTGVSRIRALLTKGSTVREGPLKLVGLPMVLPTNAPAQVAFAVPKRYMRHAVQRNRMKRLMREAYRLNKEKWYAPLREQGTQCAWLFVYQSREELGLDGMAHRLTRALDRWMKEHG
jgi:ribonuclease P protein component